MGKKLFWKHCCLLSLSFPIPTFNSRLSRVATGSFKLQLLFPLCSLPKFLLLSLSMCVSVAVCVFACSCLYQRWLSDVCCRPSIALETLIEMSLIASLKKALTKNQKPKKKQTNSSDFVAQLH